jgi:peptidoglycan/LPS O-acetylase OafA/YrhL
MQRDRVQYLEGLRGIAAIQVVLLHFVTGFMPETARQAWPPLRVLFDGHTAVYVFFLISGAVLTPSFARPGPFIAKLAKRVVRLGIPVAAAAVVATLLLAAWPHAHMRAASITGSAWLAMDSSGVPTFRHLAREIGVDSLLLGYREATLFAPLADRLTPMELSLDAPFWSLHLELYGSLLVLVLVWLRARSVWLHRAAVAVAALLFGAQPMFLFVFGHLLASIITARADRRRLNAMRSLAGALLLATGLALATTKDWNAVAACRQWLIDLGLGTAPNLFQFASQLAAALIFVGTLFCMPAQALLERPPCRRLGRLSFSVYLLHFPVLFTIGCLILIDTQNLLPYAAALGAVFIGFITVTLVAAALFERWIDRPAIALSRRAGELRLQTA